MQQHLLRVLCLAAMVWGCAVAKAQEPTRAPNKDDGGLSPSTVLTLREAQVVATVAGQRLPTKAIELPFHWDAVVGSRPGTAEFTLRFDLAPSAAAMREPHTLFIERLGSAYEIELNGVLLKSAGVMVGPGDRWRAKHPVTLTVPSRMLGAENVLRVRIRAATSARGGLSVVVIGPESAVMPIADRAEFWRVGVPWATAVLSLMVATFCALLWWQQREALYAWAGLGAALLALVVVDMVLESAPLPTPYWGMALLTLRAALWFSLYAFAQEVYGRFPRLEFWSIAAIQASVPIWIWLMFALRSLTPVWIWWAVGLCAFAWANTRMTWQAWRLPTTERITTVLAMWALMMASARDTWSGRRMPALYAELPWVSYAAGVFLLALMWVVSQRFLRARAETVALNASLQQRVEQKEHELRDSFARLSEIERSRAVLAERSRILSDMHDGVGSNLATAVRQLESGKALPQEVAQTLRESMDHLKLSIDALKLPRGDVNALLASLRYRLQPRIESAGLQVKWHVDALPLWAVGDDQAMRHLQFLLLEIISNVLQHAHASTLCLGARAKGADLEIVLADDGCGLKADPRFSLRSLRQRADAIGASLVVEPAHPGTRVVLMLKQTVSAAVAQT